MERYMQRLIARGAVLVVGVSMVSGCADNTPPPAQRVDNPAAGTAEKPSNLSYGTVTATVKKNVTTQSDLIDMFGGPNISTTDKDGSEKWVYERTSSMNDTAGSTQDKNFNAFFGGSGNIGNASVGGGVSGSKSSSANQQRSVNSVRTLTAVITFNADKTVKDYTVRASYF